MGSRTTFLLIACFWVARAFASEETAEARAAKYYAQGLEQPLLQLRAGAALILACKGRLRSACDKEQRKLATENHVLALLDALTLFPQRLESDPLAPVRKPLELRRKIGETSAAMMREAGEYDRELFARYGATLLACPGEQIDVGLYRATLSGLMNANYSGFQALSPPELAAAIEATYEREEVLSGSLRQWPPGECQAARELGAYLMQLMNSKLLPWMSPDGANGRTQEFDFSHPRKDDVKDSEATDKKRELANAVAGNFVSVVATELQLLVYPETAPRIKELADQAGFPSED